MLNVHSYYSFKYGIYAIEKLIEWAQECGIKTLALTDINNTSGNLEFVRQSKKVGIRPLLGIDFRQGAIQQFIGLAKNNTGYHQLNSFLSKHLHSETPIPPTPPEGISDCFVIYPFQSIPKRKLKAHEYVGIKPHEINRARFMKGIPKDKLIACPTFTLPKEDDFELHCVLRAIDLNTLVSKLRKEDTGQKEDVFIDKKQLISAYEELPQALENLKYVIQNCSIDFQFSPDAEPQNLEVWTDSREGDYRKVKQLCKEGLPYRYGQNPERPILKRVVTELQTIRDKGFLSYFLISWDIVNYARSKGYYYVGRGSGANSIIAYLLRITDVDPIELDLYFERFINLFRRNPPDFDIDFSSRDRDDVTRYIFDRYPNAVLLATFNTFQHRAVIREVGKAFGIPPYEIDKLQKDVTGHLDHHSRVIVNYGLRLSGFPSHLSVHAGGIIISERPIHYFTATSLPPKGFPITHFDMHVAEDVGLFKFDILGQRGLGKIKDALEIIRKNQPNRLNVDIHDIKLFKEDPLIKINLREAKAIGCFYVESPAMRMLLTKLRCDDYLTLVAASSVIRPGVAKSGMMREYILRYRIPERRNDAHPVLRKIMPDTYGVMVYQEDVIKVAHHFAGLTLAEADVLRRGMSGKYRSREEFQQVKHKFFENCKKRGHSIALSADVWRQIESFAGYAFAKGHSASYAIESYQSMFLKSHYPLEFMVAVLNNGGGFYSPEFYVHEARMHGAHIEPPCINTSEPHNIIRGKTIYLGLALIKELEDQTIIDTVAQRIRKGPYKSLDEYVHRVSISLEQVSLLIRIDAFRFTGIDKKTLLWRAHFLLGNTGKSQTKPSLFEPPVKNYQLPNIEHTEIEDVYDQMELLGFPLRTPFSLLNEKPEGCLKASDFPHQINKHIRTYGYLITTKRTNTSKGEQMYFGNFLDEDGEFIDTVHFPPVAKKYPFNGRGIYVMEGKVIEEFDAICIEVTRMQRLNYKTIEV
ncbi:DNA polymerase III subunit alpha [Marinoscillum sp. MHG1-6]|uniref:DNA polymerase III subunit alpha n=1 Tax=Marinoscillum sp. MHG1-6 TaxID=2959627 RepID=UPI0021586DC5|nr:DNA polymerase III subunit alpha [Marinoscillum sp. MHG1-6]